MKPPILHLILQILPGLLIVLFVSAVFIEQIKICTDHQYIGRKQQSEFNIAQQANSNNLAYKVERILRNIGADSIESDTPCYCESRRRFVFYSGSSPEELQEQRNRLERLFTSNKTTLISIASSIVVFFIVLLAPNNRKHRYINTLCSASPVIFFVSGILYGVIH